MCVCGGVHVCSILVRFSVIRVSFEKFKSSCTQTWVNDVAGVPLYVNGSRAAGEEAVAVLPRWYAPMSPDSIHSPEATVCVSWFPVHTCSRMFSPGPPVFHPACKT